MSIENIVFESNDTFEQVATKTALIFAGTTELKTQMKRLKIEYTKVQRGVNTIFVLRHKNFNNGRLEIKL